MKFIKKYAWTFAIGASLVAAGLDPFTFQFFGSSIAIVALIIWKDS